MANNTLPDALNIYILTYNCAKNPISIDAFSTTLFSNLTSLPDLLVLNIQELAPIPQSLIGGSFLMPYFQNFSRAVSKAARKFAGETEADGEIYTPVVARNLGLTGIVVFARDPACIRDTEIGGVGTGPWNIGNKGAIGARFTYESEGISTELTFVSAHLAAFEDGLQERNENWKTIVRGLVFYSVGPRVKNQEEATDLVGEGEAEEPLLSVSPKNAGIFKPTSHLFFSGDLNYRTSILPPTAKDSDENFPQPNMAPHAKSHFRNFFQNDQLNQERRAKRTLHGLIEAEVTFPPTYKYGSEGPFGVEDEDLRKWDWAKHRWPSWCDRILYLPIPPWLDKSNPETKIVTKNYKAFPLMSTSDHRAVGLEVKVPLVRIPVPEEDELEESEDPRISPPFTIDPNWKTNREKARRYEILVGFVLYFTMTKEGGAVLVAIAVGMVGAVFVIKALLGV